MYKRQRQSSLNGSQAVLDDDGIFRGVIAHRDPGVPNWIDPEGHTRGTIGIRYLFPEHVAQPSLQSVPVEQLRSILPASTPEVPPDERRAMIERRRRAVQRRYRY